jgi:DNA-damage-inducible protein D
LADSRRGRTRCLKINTFDDQASERIRHVPFHGELYYSVIDVIALLTGARIPRNYWSDLKRRLAEDEGYNELHANIVQLQLTAADGKQRLTDCVNDETLLRIIQSIPSPRAEPFKQWLAKVGHERLQEIENPSLAADRMRQHYRALGYSDEWINARMQGIVVRDELTQEWHERGAKEGKQFAALTEILHSGTFDISSAEHKAVKQLRVNAANCATR